METYTLTNNFHNSSVRVRAQATQHIWSEIEITLTDSQKKRTKRVLCGVSGCACSGADGTRGRQTHDNGRYTSDLIIW